MISILLWTGCSKNNFEDIDYRQVAILNKSLKLELTKEKEVGFEVLSKNAAQFAKIDGMNDSIDVMVPYACGKNTSFLRFNTNLEPMGKFVLPYGQGPGETITTRFCNGNSQKVMVFDPMNSKYSFFTPQMKVINETRCTKMYGIIHWGCSTYKPDRNAFVAAYMKHHDYYKGVAHVLIHTIKSGTITDKLIYEIPHTFFPRKEESVMGSPVHISVSDDYIYILDKREYRILKVDYSGKVIRAIKVSSEKKFATDRQRAEWAQKATDYNVKGIKLLTPREIWPAGWLVAVNDGLAVSRVINYDTDDDTSITADYFDLDLNYIGKINLPFFRGWNNPSSGSNNVDLNYYYKDGKMYAFDVDVNKDSELVWKIIKYNVQIETEI
ncbi:MAG: hypothetical protein GY765_21200 [bacterium]|nr:hypothetical protein [bacterium]